MSNIFEKQTAVYMSAWIGVDLDGTLAKYDGYKGPHEIGEPIPEMVNRIKKWLAEGKVVKIFTARACIKDHIPPVQEYILKHIGVPLEVTNVKDYAMAELWDDRAVRVRFNEGVSCCDHYEESFREKSKKLILPKD